ncbi:MAG: DUF1905 domain-containing protein [Flavobacteriales bacterium]|nr:DUF1905 domain-containing protein [Flavobacteriales bacterium]MCB9166512.1 DUF1905 domain-containing protein [Flavobacteriales bacterium]
MARRTAERIRFSARVEKMSGRFAWTYVEFPHDVKKTFGVKGSFRVLGTINGVVMDRALMPTKSGFHVIALGQDLRRKANVRVGDVVEVEVWPNPEPDKVPVPEELRETLDFLPEFKAAWQRIPPGKQRNICIWIDQARTTPTRAKRVAELLRRFETGHPWFAPGKE